MYLEEHVLLVSLISMLAGCLLSCAALSLRQSHASSYEALSIENLKNL